MSIERPWTHHQEEFDFNAALPTENVAPHETRPPGTVPKDVMQIEAGDIVRESTDPLGEAQATPEDEYTDRVVEDSKPSPDGDWTVQFKDEDRPRHYDRGGTLNVVQN